MECMFRCRTRGYASPLIVAHELPEAASWQTISAITESHVHVPMSRDLPVVLILFPDDWAAYSPTLTRLTAELASAFRVRVYAIDSGRFDNSVLDPKVYRRVRIHRRVAWATRKIGLYKLMRACTLAYRARQEAKHAAHVIAVDADGAVAARILDRHFHFLSLEIGWHPVLRMIVARHARSIIIQSRERLEAQFDSKEISHVPVFFVQNAPDLGTNGRIRSLQHPIDSQRPKFVYLGHAIPLHGLISMLDLIAAWPGATLTLQGIHPERSVKFLRGRYGTLLETGAVKFGTGYVAEQDLSKFLGHFDIGLCLYDLDRRHRRDINYLSSPAGKMFNYFSAGVPVIASSQTGLNPVSQHRAGIQVPDNTVGELKAATLAILANYQFYRDGCLRASVHYDFRSSAGRFIDFLEDRAARS